MIYPVASCLICIINIFVCHLIPVEHFFYKWSRLGGVSCLFFGSFLLVFLLFRVSWSQLLRKEPALSETADAQTVSHCTVVAMVGS